VSVRLDRVVPRGKTVELAASEMVVLMCPTVDDGMLTRAKFPGAAFPASTDADCNDATMVGLMK
jgi:hypothetical protein